MVSPCFSCRYRSCARLLALSDLGIDLAEGRRRAEAAVADGSAEAKWREWIAAQGLVQAGDLWEYYLVGPETSPDPAEWRTEFTVPLVG